MLPVSTSQQNRFQIRISHLLVLRFEEEVCGSRLSKRCLRLPRCGVAAGATESSEKETLRSWTGGRYQSALGMLCN